MKTISGANTELEKIVQNQINNHAENYEDGAEGFMSDLMQGGCQSGLVGDLIYYTDTVEFYNNHQEEIDSLLAEICDDCGMSPSELFGDKWDHTDYLARNQLNKNLLAWFGFEEVARRLANENGIET